MNELESILSNSFTEGMLYNQLVVLDDIDSQFDAEEEKKFIITKALLEDCKLKQSQLSYSIYVKYMGNIHKIKTQTYENIKNAFKTNEWIGFQAQEAKENDMKIYLSIDNNWTHFFINHFFAKCIEQEVNDYDFKINDDESINRRENVVIYCSNENIGKYIILVQEIIKEHPEIKFNKPHLLGIPYNDKIYCGCDYDNGETSYTQKWASDLFKAYQKGKSAKSLAEEVDYFKAKEAPNLYALVDRAKLKR